MVIDRKEFCKRGHLRTPENLTKDRTCKICKDELSKIWRQNNLERIQQHQAKWRKDNSIKREQVRRYKTHCKNGHPRTPDNIASNGACKICKAVKDNQYNRNSEKQKETKKRWIANNPDKVIEKTRRYRAKNPDKVKEWDRRWRVNNPDKIKENNKKYNKPHRESDVKWKIDNADKMTRYKREWKLRNPEKVLADRVKRELEKPEFRRALTAKRRAAKLKRTPPWLTKDHLSEIRAFYNESKILTKITGVIHHVDHIVPLQGKTVSGLHVPWNLQVITAEENFKKNNILIKYT